MSVPNKKIYLSQKLKKFPTMLIERLRKSTYVFYDSQRTTVSLGLISKYSLAQMYSIFNFVRIFCNTTL